MNKIKSLIIIFALANATFGTAQSNDSTVHRSVNVSREFQPVINDAGKVISLPKITEPNVEKSSPIYSDIATPLGMEYNVYMLKAEELLHTPTLAKKGFVRVGFGYPTNTLADFMYPIWTNEKNRLDVSLNHLGAWKDKKHSKTAAALKYNHLFNNFDLYAGVSGQHDFFNYYGLTFAGESPEILSDIAAEHGSTVFNLPDSKWITLHDLSTYTPQDNHWRINVNAGLRSLPLAENLIFDAGVHYNRFQTVNSGLAENEIALKGHFDVPFENNRLGIVFETSNFQYNQDLSMEANSKSNYSVIKINPFWKLVGENSYLRLGAKTGISIGQGQIFTPSPDIAAQWNAVPRYLALYGGVTGDLKVNSLNSIFNENRYLLSNIGVQDTYTPIDAYLGLKLSPVHNLLLDVYGEYEIIKNQYFYVNKAYTSDLPTVPELNKFYFNRFDVVYSAANKASVGLHTAWDYKNLFNLYLKAAYHYWNVKDEAKAWHLPTWDANVGANVNITNDISVNTSFVFQDGRYAKLSNEAGTKLAPVTDWSVGAAYAYRNWLSAFVKVNNILNKQYYIYNGYDVQGINVMVGAAFSF
ncbi:MAG TPA: hypothetical protein GXZ87_02545 [Bacteroidales bacterium]|nr:hypothetical protein [Bacteroidales bacterium]